MNAPLYSIETAALTAKSGSGEAISGLNLRIPRKSVVGLLGREGAGKSTLLRVLVNLSRPVSGTATVSGVPCRRLKPAHFTRIGYVPQEAKIPGWMKAGAFLRYCRGFYPDWDDAFCESLAKAFRIKPDRRIGSASPGFRAKLSLIASLAYRPSVLLLDDPFRHVEPRERDAMIRGIMELIDLDDWCIVIAARETDEVERMADWVGLLRRGRLELSESTASLQRRFRQVEAFVMEPKQPAGGFPETWLRPRFEGQCLRFLDTRFDAKETPAQVRALMGEACSVESHTLSFRKIFDELDKTYEVTSRSS